MKNYQFQESKRKEIVALPKTVSSNLNICVLQKGRTFDFRRVAEIAEKYSAASAGRPRRNESSFLIWQTRTTSTVAVLAGGPRSEKPGDSMF